LSFGRLRVFVVKFKTSQPASQAPTGSAPPIKTHESSLQI